MVVIEDELTLDLRMMSSENCLASFTSFWNSLPAGNLVESWGQISHPLSYTSLLVLGQISHPLSYTSLLEYINALVSMVLRIIIN